jgi:hypothetical protein
VRHGTTVILQRFLTISPRYHVGNGQRGRTPAAKAGYGERVPGGRNQRGEAEIDGDKRWRRKRLKDRVLKIEEGRWKSMAASGGGGGGWKRAG